MRLFLFFLGLFLLIGAVLLGFGVALGFLLHWLLPSVELGIGILIGIITLALTAQLFMRTMSLPLLDDEPEYAESLTPQRIVTLIPDSPPRRRGRNRKATEQS
jgi:hypothetical protein